MFRKYVSLSVVLLVALTGCSAIADLEGWSSRDIGIRGGYAVQEGNTIIVTADGADIGGTADQFHYVYKELKGDCEISARVVDMGRRANGWAKAGVMIRGTLGPGSRHAMMVLTPEGRAAFQHRKTDGGSSYSAYSDQESVSMPYWVKLVRSGNEYTGYHSSDGIEWIPQGNTHLDPVDDPNAANPATVEMAPDLYIGLCYTSHDPERSNTAVFDNVSVSELNPPLISIEETGGSTTVSEEGTTWDQYILSGTSVRKPEYDVVITLEYEPDQIQIEPDVITYTPSDWGEPRTITVMAIDDNVIETNPHTTTISHIVTSEDPFFDGSLVDNLSVIIIEDEILYDDSWELPVKSPPPALACVECYSAESVFIEGIGDPIYGFSGEYYKSVVDLRIPGRGLDFIWARKYRSRIGPDTRQGNGWDFSYNIRIERDGDDLILFDGNTRRDRFILQPDGTWAADGFCWEFTREPDGTITMMCPDTGTWHFRPLDHACCAGRITAISDRNGNTMTFEYDLECRLVKIHDTLDTQAHNRDITIIYNADGFIESVTDFIGRQVRYEYYQDGDAGGSFGDLKSVTTPAVTGTPNSNDFPQGKTTVYTYSKGFADEQLNHNLLTITDPRGQTFLTNIYAPTQDRNELDFDRVTRQIWGDPYDIIDITYVSQTPSAQNNHAIIKTIVNDRVGNVKEYFYDSSNQLVVQKEYTGRADPDQPTTETQNRPTGKLRPGDPAFFETRWQYNADFRPSRIDYPNGNYTLNVYELDLNPDAPRRSRCNLREVRRLPGPLEPISDHNMIVEFYEYDVGMGGCCGTNFVTRHVDGRGNETIHEYDDRGNRLRTQHRIPSIVEDWEYNEFGQTTKHILPDNGSGHRRVDLYTYHSNASAGDLNGDGLVDLLDLAIFCSAISGVGDGRADIFPPGGDGVVDERDFREFASLWLASSDPSSFNPQNGYLKSTIIDANNLRLTTTYEYDAVGNLISQTDPQGHDTRYIYNQLDQVVREISPQVTNPNGVRYEKDTYYDKNDNVVRVDIQNIDDKGALQANTHFTTIYEYDILNYRTRACQEVGDYTGAIPGPAEQPTYRGLPQSEFITTEYGCDANRNRTLVRYGEAAEGRQRTNIVRILYDERDLAFREIRAEGDPNQSTTQYDYDGNKNVVKTSQGLESAPRITSNTHDGYNRLVLSKDPMGNVTTFHYDENGNQTSLRADGELTDDDPDGTNNVRLSESTYVYDAMDRLIRTEVEFFDSSTQTAIGDGNSVTRTEYSDNSQVILVTNDNNHAAETTYDTANRRLAVTDAKGNTITYSYDESSNVIAVTEVEKSDLGHPDEVLVTTYAYDCLDRLVQSVDNVGNTHTYSYDSRDNRTVKIDALNHVTRYEYDGINRLTSTVRDLDGDGDDITTGQTWDDTSRLIGQTDDNGNRTSYAYDARNRLTVMTYADGTQRSADYDVHDNLVKLTDSNGSVVTSTYDLLNRLIRNDIVAGPGVSNDTTFENYACDGLSRLVRAEDDDSLVTHSYDSLSNITRETLNGQTTACIYDGVGNQTQCTYPGGRIITCTYDELERKKTISDASGVIAAYDYIGPSRVKRREYGNGTCTDYTYDGISGIPNPSGDFGVKRIIRTTHSKIVGGSIIDDRTYTWDPMYNKTQRRDIRAGGPQLTHNYTYDNTYRLVHTAVTDNVPAVVRETNYSLDGVGNRTNVAGSPEPGPYTMDPTTPIPADFQVNQYTTTSFDARLYDDNGNLITIDSNQPTEKIIAYDYRNRMVKYTDTSSGQVHTYAYDTMGRRIEKVVDSAGTPQTTRYLYDGWQVIEEQDENNVTQATYIYGNYIDEALNMQRGGTDYYYHTDDLYNVMAVTDGSGTTVEHYEYGDYGDPDFLDAAGSPIASTTIGNPHLFTGRRYDLEVAWYYYRTRYFDSAAGRFTIRDAIGVWRDSTNLGNGYAYVGNNPFTYFDPMGLKGHNLEKLCPKGWKFVSGPSSIPEPIEESLEDITRTVRLSTWSWGKDILAKDRRARIEHEWEAVPGVKLRGNCGQACTFTAAISFEKSSIHTLSIGVIMNLPFGPKENIEFTGAYEYSWGTTEGKVMSTEIHVEKDPCYEHLGIPVVMKLNPFTVGKERKLYPLAETGYKMHHYRYGKEFEDFKRPRGEPFYTGEIGIVVCKKKCK